ncbi:MAG: hypothetical protein C4534_08255 [Gaiellales bacterium]|nr:MAG: hypothetical protein C4534_08255 [Gaiellales bacterium]
MAQPLAKLDNETLLISGLGIAGGLGLIVYALTRGGLDWPPTRPPFAGDSWGVPSSPTLDTPGQIPISLTPVNPSTGTRGAYFKVMAPAVQYAGPGRNAYSAVTILQPYGSGWAAVYGSGVAGARMFPAQVLTPYTLVAPNQPQPDGTVGPDLWAYPFPGTTVGPICGIPPQRGVPGTVVLAVCSVVDESCEGSEPNPACAPDYDGFASPTCSYSPHPRLAVTKRVWKDKVIFV